ncbi:cyclic nucleotide-gated ion channel 1-like [Prunus yedoensis var. nudiflora]|uniref:Cyclic nucleotide-gated ion channel 1-like n=1 Tax=Prunus yedoensis var. nudiflora TaxID=2094558 RepID=A0A314YRQ1_PRUYE|nr:cyclic nucleotide-gated ion channel 1-like [Prunus yedoensis var. nudiflora]
MDSTRLASDPEKQTQKPKGRVKTGIMYAAAAKIKKICNPQGQYGHIWNKMFVISCVFAVSLDPLFFYILIIDQQNKCLQMDKMLQNVALVLRSLTDIIFLLHFIYEICDGLKTQTKKKSPPSTSETKLASDTPKTTAPNTQSNGHSNSKVETGEHSGPKSKIRLIGIAQELMPWLSVSIVIDFFALLPIPQTFMQMQATKSEEMRKKIKIKKLDIQSWISKNKVPDDIKKEIMKSVKQKLKEHKDADLHNDLYSILPGKTRTSLKRCLCMDAFKTVPMLENMSKKVLEMMCEYLKPVMYNENSFPFRMGDPLDRMLFIIDGTMWTYSGGGGDEAAASPSNVSTLLVAKPLGKGEIYGEELLSWASPSITQLPISTKHLKSQTKVEAFALMAKDLATIVSRYELQWENNKGDKSQEVKEDMALSKITTVLVPRFRLTRNNRRPTNLTKRVTAVGSNNLSTTPPPIN